MKNRISLSNIFSFIFNILLLLSTIGCENKQTNILFFKNNTEVVDTINNSSISMKNLIDSIDIYTIKMKGQKYSTTTFESQNTINKKEYYTPDNSGYFGHYTLFYCDSINYSSEHVGYMTIYNTTRPWTYSSKSDLLIELLIHSDKVKIFYNLTVNVEINKFIEFLGNPIAMIDNIMIFEIGDSQYLSTFIKNDTVKMIKIVRCRDDFSNKNVRNNVLDFSY